MRAMRPLRVILLTLAGIWLFAMAMLAPQFVELHNEKNAVNTAFSIFSYALVNHDYLRAYEQCGPEFRQVDPYEKFAVEMDDFENRYGRLKAVKRVSLHLTGDGNPAQWRTSMTAAFDYERKSIQFKIAFHKVEGRWLLFGLQQM
jgi:hypothetical protein